MRTHLRSSALLAAALATATLGLAGCADPGVSSPAAANQAATPATEVEVFTWWASGSEKLGLDALVNEFGAQHPAVRFIDGAVAGGAGSAAKDLLQSRLQANDPPDTFQVHAGAELGDYIEAGQVEDIAHLYVQFGLRDVFPAELVDRLMVDGKIYSIPSNIHRANVVWANPNVLAAAGLDPTAAYTTVDEWLDAFAAIQAAGYTPLSIATTWTQVHLLETILLAELGASSYTGLWDGSTDWASTDVTAALATFETVLGYTNTDRDGLDWPDATQRVMDGEAAFNVMGDWAVAAFEEAGKVEGTDYIYFPVPGTYGVFDFLADSFTLPVGAPNPEGAKAWLETVGSASGQVAFNLAKGSIPARTDMDPTIFSAYQQSAISSFGEDRIVSSLAHGAATRIAWLNAISDATSKFTTGGSDLATFQAELVTAAGYARVHRERGRSTRPRSRTPGTPRESVEPDRHREDESRDDEPDGEVTTHQHDPGRDRLHDQDAQERGPRRAATTEQARAPDDGGGDGREREIDRARPLIRRGEATRREDPAESRHRRREDEGGDEYAAHRDTGLARGIGVSARRPHRASPAGATQREIGHRDESDERGKGHPDATIRPEIGDDAGKDPGEQHHPDGDRAHGRDGQLEPLAANPLTPPRRRIAHHDDDDDPPRRRGSEEGPLAQVHEPRVERHVHRPRRA